ncbi:MAG: polysaccharide export outer membrane protein [Desulforhopalus sp.]
MKQPLFLYSRFNVMRIDGGCVMHRFLSVSFLFFVVMSMSGCGSDPRFKETVSLDDFRKEAVELSSESHDNDILVMPLMPEQDNPAGDYLLGAGDLLSIIVFETEDLNSEVRVSSTGIINVALLGDVNVLNLSAAEAEQKIEDLYAKDYLHNPHVSVHIKEHVSKQITLLGAVKTPGTFNYVSRRRLLDILAMGNGLTEEAGSFGYITRHDSKSGSRVSYMVDLDELMKKGDMASNHAILGGDVIYIPESGQCFVDGAVRQPGTYPISNNMSVSEAIALAGGLASYADDDSIKLVRYMGRGRERKVVSLSYSQLQAGVGDTLILQDQDIIFAESSATGKLMAGSGLTIGFMGTGVSFSDPEARRGR